MAKFRYPFVTYPAAEGGFVAEVPALKGCLAQGDTLSETLEELAIVEALWIDTARKNGIKLPRAKKEIERVRERLAA